MIQYIVEQWFAGVWGFALHWGIAGGIILICLVCEVLIEFSGPFASWLRPFQKDLLWVAVAAAAYLFAFTQGVNVEAARCKAQQAVLLKQVGRVVDSVTNDPANEPKPLIKGQKRTPPADRWDRPEN
jgi:hypothetical protein